MTSNRLDRLIAYLSPGRGEARIRSRVIMEALLAYEGATRDRGTQGWITASTSADAEIWPAMMGLRDRARDLVRNNPHAAKGVAVLVASRVGTGILCEAASKNKAINRRVDERWNAWADACDYYGKHDLYGLQALAERARIESGESLIRFVPTERTSETDLPFRIMVLEADYLADSKDEVLGEGHEIRRGIEYKGGIPIAYHLYDAHPGDSGLLAISSRGSTTRYPASDVIHYYRVERPGQRRGVTELCRVIRRLRDVDDWHAAKLMRAKIAACAIGAVTTPSNLPAASLAPVTTDAQGRKIEAFAPGQWYRFDPGEHVEFFDPKPLDDSGFTADELHAVAAGLDLPYELLTGDLSEVTYTSHRGGLVQFRGRVEADQWQLLLPQVCERIRGRFLAELSGIDALVPTSVKTTYTPPRFGLLDPSKEVPAMIEAIRAGIYSYQNTIRREGYDPQETLDEIEAWQKELDARGIVLSSDARKSKGGSPAPAAVPEPEPEPEPGGDGNRESADED